MIAMKQILLTITVMLGLPWLAVTFAPGEAGMAICFLLFFAVDPVYAICMGIAAGKELRKLWYQPLLTSLLFLVGTWLLFDPGESAFLQYAFVYLGLGTAAMAVTEFLQWKRS